jgi:hypothetical protein
MYVSLDEAQHVVIIIMVRTVTILLEIHQIQKAGTEFDAGAVT